jgi:hypothetical protein
MTLKSLTVVGALAILFDGVCLSALPVAAQLVEVHTHGNGHVGCGFGSGTCDCLGF